MGSSTRNFHLQPSYLAIAPRQISTMFFFFNLVLVPSVTPVSFTFYSFNTSNRDMEYEGDAFPSNDLIQLTKNQAYTNVNNCSGRAIYRDPVRIWDRATGRLTDFTSQFSFSIDTLDRSVHGDGLAFFLAANRSLPSNSAGSCLGLMNCDTVFNTSHDPYLAVEFDTFENSWDPSYDHIGININSLASVQTVRWLCESNVRNKAVVSYNSSTKNLSVVLSYDDRPDSYSSITHLVDLRDYLPEWVTVGFSASTGKVYQIHSIQYWEFQSTLETVERRRNETVAESQRNETAAVSVPRKKKNMWMVLVPCVVGILLGGFGLIWFLCRKKGRGSNQRYNGPSSGELEQTKNEKDTNALINNGQTRNQGNDDVPTACNAIIIEETSNGSPSDDEHKQFAGWPREFSYRELADATNDFKGSVIVKGSSGEVFKGSLRNQNLEVAIKKFSKVTSKTVKEFESEVKALGRLRHENLVQLYGWCKEEKELLVVYEFMPNGSLFDHLFEDKRLLTWKVRYNIILDLAHALLHLHEEGRSYIVHRNIKSRNVWLDVNFTAKLWGFGWARLVEEGEDPPVTYLAGSGGYLAPEWRSSIVQKPSKESDIYSFGIVALEIGCGRKTLELVGETTRELVQWVWMLYGKGDVLEAADPRLSREFHENEMECLLVVGLWCAHPHPSARPTIGEAIDMLLKKAPLPRLPQEMPLSPDDSPPVAV